MFLEDLIKRNQNIIADGAMGTYYIQEYENDTKPCEFANIYNPERIYSIHREYIEAGANIIRTNTFSANTKALGVSLEEVLKIVEEGYKTAKKAAEDKAVILCDMSETVVEDNEEDIVKEYISIIDKFLELGGTNFLFESLSSVSYFSKLAKYIKSRDKNNKVMISFALSPRGRTYLGESIKRLSSDILNSKEYFDIVGLNCGCGPIHTVNFIKELKSSLEDEDFIFSAMPNSGYSDGNINLKNNEAYFSEMLSSGSFLKMTKIIGGCCGTTPKHIKRLSEKIKSISYITSENIRIMNNIDVTNFKRQSQCTNFNSKLSSGKLVLAAELDPPYGNDITKLIDAAKKLSDSGIDIITISDSPMARARMDPVVCSAKIKREVKIDVLPHICCRDRNLNAIKSILLAMNCEEIDTVLAVTGDKISDADKKYVKSVFDLNSITLMKLITNMNEDVFSGRPVNIGGALNFDFKSEKAFYDKVAKKIEAGLKFFLTQPVYEEKSVEIIKKVRRMGAKVLVGIMPIVSYKNAMFMNNEIQGIDIPEEYVNRFSPDMDRETALNAGLGIVKESIKMSREQADGYYFMTPFNRADIICRVIEENREILYG